jgi:hypothetical protein
MHTPQQIAFLNYVARRVAGLPPKLRREEIDRIYAEAISALTPEQLATLRQQLRSGISDEESERALNLIDGEIALRELGLR